MSARTMPKSTLIALNSSLSYRADRPISLPAVAAASAGEKPSVLRGPPGAQPCVAVTLPSDVVVASGGLSVFSGDAVGQTTLAQRGQHQCCFPLWPHSARPGHTDYGLVCGERIAPGKPGERTKSYCAHHEGVVTGSHAETQKAKRIVRATVRKARACGVA